MARILAVALLSLLAAIQEAEATFRTPKTIKAAAAPRYFGAALAAGHLINRTDTAFARTAAAEFSSATPENEMKWEIIEPFQGKFNFTEGDIVAKFAKRNNQKLRCHNLVWHSQLAPYVSTLSGNALKKAMLSHIEGTAGHYKGACYAWDVVNEPLDEDGSFRDSPFLTAMGEDYIEIALRKARQVDPHAKLYINDFNIEGINNKSTAMFNLFKKLTRQKLVDGIGFESHFLFDGIPPDMLANMKRFANLGVDVAVTELDLRGDVPFSAADKALQAKNYATIVNNCQAVSRCVGVTIWGITDRYSWIPGFFDGMGEALPWDENYRKKESYFSTLRAFASRVF